MALTKTFTCDAFLTQDGRTKTFAADAVLTLGAGVITLGAQTLTVDYKGIKPKYYKRTSKHSILGATNSKRQYTGSDSTIYEVSGIWDGATRDADMAIMRAYYQDHDVVAFQGYTALAVQTRILELKEVEYAAHWEWKIKIEETGLP